MANNFQHWSWTNRTLENWILRTVDDIQSADDHRISELYQAALAMNADIAEQTDVIITFEELLKEKGIDVGRHCIMPTAICRLYGW